MQKSCFGYPVEFVEDVFGGSPVLAEILKKVTGRENARVLIVADMNVVQRLEGLGQKIGRYVQEHGIVLADSPVVIAGGEKAKADNFQTALTVVSAMLSAKLGKDDVILALGGGALLDIAGYAAAQVRGGVKIVRLPTTPAAMMDAAYADYAAVDSASVKDALRVASVPAAVIIDTTFATSVLDGVWRGGISEAVRLAVAKDATLMKKLVRSAAAYSKRDAATLREIVKAVFETRRKKGASSAGLWVASRLEPMSGYKLPHGYAVAIGLCIDIGYAVEKDLLKEKDANTIIGLLREGGALDGLNHSARLLEQADNLIYGLDAWALISGRPTLPVLHGIGKVAEEEPDRDLFKTIFKKVISIPPAG